MKSSHQARVEEFMRQAGQDVPDEPCIPNATVCYLRACLILEEALETIEALGFEVECSEHGGQPEVAIKPECREPDIEGVLDGCADLSVVTIGTLSAFGVADQPLLKEVDMANLRKFGDGAYRREDGKWMKPKDWAPPDIMGVWWGQGGQ